MSLIVVYPANTSPSIETRFHEGPVHDVLSVVVVWEATGESGESHSRDGVTIKTGRLLVTYFLY